MGVFSEGIRRFLAGALVAVVSSSGCAPVGAPSASATSAVAPRPDCRLVDAGSEGAEQVRWILAPDREDQPILDSWCASVGPPVFQAGDVLGATDAVDSILVVTWNVHVGGGDVAGFVAALRAGRFTSGRPVEHFVLLLQEAYRAADEVPAVPPGGRAARRIATLPPGGERSDIEATARALGVALFYVPSMRNGARATDAEEDRGNAVLATLPLSDPAAIELPFEAQRRVGVAASLRFRDGSGERRTLRVVSVHLDHRSRLARGLATFGPARTRQARAAARAVQQYESSVLGGDLNTWAPVSLEETLELLGERFPDTPRGDGQPTFITAGIVPRQLDHLFFRLSGGFASAPTRIDDRFGSDHFPVAAWISYPRPGAPLDQAGADSSATTPRPAPRAACCGPGTGALSTCPSGC